MSNKTLWIVVGVVGGVLLLCCGGGIAGLVVGGLVLDDAIDEARANDTPRAVEVGAAFEHDDYAAGAGWRVEDDGYGAFDVTGLTLTNQAGRTRTAALDFTVYVDGTVVGEVRCYSTRLGPDEEGSTDCYSVDDFDAGFDEVRVADAY